MHELIDYEQDLLMSSTTTEKFEISTCNVPCNPWQQLASSPSSRLSAVPEGRIWHFVLPKLLNICNGSSSNQMSHAFVFIVCHHYPKVAPNLQLKWSRNGWSLRSAIILIVKQDADVAKVGRHRDICTAPEMIPTPKWSPTLKWSPNRPRNDPQLILGMELVFRHGIITNLLQRLRSYTAFNISLQIENVTVKNSIFPSSLPMRPRSRLNLIPNRLSSQKMLK